MDMVSASARILMSALISCFSRALKSRLGNKSRLQGSGRWNAPATVLLDLIEERDKQCFILDQSIGDL